MPKSLAEKFSLRSRLTFELNAGRIWLDENRMLLLHSKAMGALRREIFETLGPVRARGLLLRLGFATGRQDADLALKLMADRKDDYDVFQLGPELHSFEGIVKSTITESTIDWESGRFLGTVELRNSWEAEAHLEHFGPGHDCACWSVTGHASGYTSHFFKQFIVFREVKCIAKGDDRCVIVGKPVEEWGDDPTIELFRGDQSDAWAADLQRELDDLRGGPAAHPKPPGKLVGQSPRFREAFDLLAKAANAPISVLLLGETGVGKEVFARWIHENSNRSDGSFVAVNCGAIPQDLMESELFGVQRGAFTGAQQSRAGRFERAHGGTLLLDEVGELSLAAQVKLLRVLQTGEVERLGDDQLRKVDVRVLAATNMDLKQAVAEGRFRSDLYYRLAAYPVEIPPLRERAGDIPLIASAIVERFEPVYRKALKGLSDRALRTLVSHSWPGNVRELENAIERGMLLAPQGGWIEAEHLRVGPEPPEAEGAGIDAEGHVGCADQATEERLCARLLDGAFNLEAHERRLLTLAVERAGGNLAQAARMLGISRRQLAYRLKEQG